MSLSDNSPLVGMFTSIGRLDGDIVLGHLREGLLEEIILQDRELQNPKGVCLNEADIPPKLKSELNQWKGTGKRGYFTFNGEKVTYYNLGFEPLNGERKVNASIDGLKRGKKDLLDIITPEDLKLKLNLKSIKDRVDIARGEGVSEGFANGIAVFSTPSAKKYLQEGYTDLILIKERPTPEDVGLIRQLRGIVITQGDVTAHPVILARGYGVPCVTGVDEAILEGSSMKINNSVIKEGENIIIDGSTGNIYLGLINHTGDTPSKYVLSRLLRKHETKTIKLNIDSVGSIDSLAELEPSGIGLVRTEHLLFEDLKLLNHARNLLLRINQDIDSVQYIQTKYSDLFSVLYRAFDDVRVRLLDIPSDELIPAESNRIETFGRDSVEVSRKAENFRETNPFIGANRACRLAIRDFTLYKTQIEAVRFAAKRYSREPRLIIPYIASPEEVKYLSSLIRGIDPDVQIGTMIETPSSMLRIGEISKISDFLSFGTNDLFSLMVGLSRSDSKGIRNLYKERNVSMLTYDMLLDWVNDAAGKAKAANSKIEIGICGEVDYTDGQIQRLTNVDYLSVSSDRFVYTRVQSARNH